MDLCRNVASLSALQALAESTRMDVMMSCILLSLVVAREMEALNHRWKCLQTERTGPCSCRELPSLPNSLCTFSSTWI